MPSSLSPIFRLSLTFEAFLERMKTAGPSRVRIDPVGDDELLWTELHDGECVCPHVRQNVVRLDPKLCLCGETWVRLLVERHARRRADVELVESVSDGRAQLHLPDSPARTVLISSLRAVGGPRHWSCASCRATNAAASERLCILSLLRMLLT